MFASIKENLHLLAEHQEQWNWATSLVQKALFEAEPSLVTHAWFPCNIIKYARAR